MADDDPLTRIAATAQPNQAPITIGRREAISVKQEFNGPLPHPELFRQYGQVIPDAPERILRVFEEDSKHARQIRHDVLQAQREDNRRVHWMAYSLILGGFAISLVFAWMGHLVLAGTVLGTTLVGTIGGLINSIRKAPSKEGVPKDKK